MNDACCRNILNPVSRSSELPPKQRVVREAQSSSAQLRIKRTDALQDGASESHIATEQLSYPVARFGSITICQPPPVNRSEPRPQEVPRRCELSRYGIARVSHECRHEVLDPVLGGEHVVIREKDDVTPRVCQRRVAGITESLLRLIQITHLDLGECRTSSHHRRVVSRSIVDENDLCFPFRPNSNVRQGVQCLTQTCSPVIGTNNNGN